MPARELGTSSNGVHAVGSRLKKHKILPHPPEESFDPSHAKSRDFVLDTTTRTPSLTSSDTSSPRTLKHTSRRIDALPPTPPTHSRQSSASHVENSAPRYETANSSAPSTPPLQSPPHRSPPTPDITPPRALPPIAFRPASERYPSSRTDSFKTARENQFSSEEDLTTVRPMPSARESEVTVLRIPDSKRVVGLGLGLESDGTNTPKVHADEEFIVFDGEWGPTEEVPEVEREWDDNLMRNVTVRKRPRNLQTFDGAAEMEIEVSPTNATRALRSLPLQERIARHRLERDMADRRSTERFGEQIAWPSSVQDPESPTTPDVRRFSGASARSNSTVVEAMVIDTIPLRQKTLRHTKKYVGLRDQSKSSGSVSTDLHRLVHKNSRIPTRGHRSLASDTTVSTSSSRSRREVLKSGGIPVVVIPDRRSSKSSKPPSLRSTSSRRTKRSMSLGSAPLSNSSKYNEPGYFDTKPHRTESGSNSVRTIDYPPTIPARRSSLSAPTSRNTSRAGSLTAESLKAHNMTQEKLDINRPVVHNPPELKDDPTGHLSVENSDPLFARPSTHATPFSQVSYDTAGTTAEVSEALAVTLFPHQNRSLLVVQHPDSSPERQPKMEINGKATATSSHPMDEIDSPLRNPRDPPEPPVIKFIPPTPAGLTPTQEEDRQLYDEKPKRTTSLMRRAFSRRDSEPQRAGFLRTFSLRGRPDSREIETQASLFPSVADQPADDSKLHPFWRPSHFWDDLEDHDADDELRYPIIDNRPLPPKRSLSGKLKRTFAILPIQDYDVLPINRRTMRKTDDGLRVVKQRSRSSLNRQRQLEPDKFGYGFREGNGGRVHTIPGLGLKVEYVGWAAMKRRLSEKRREQRSEKLRASISTPKGVQSGIDDVLRRRKQ